MLVRISFYTLLSIVNLNCTHYSRVARMYVSQDMREAFGMIYKDQVEPNYAVFPRTTTDKDLLILIVGDDGGARLKSIDHP